MSDTDEDFGDAGSLNSDTDMETDGEHVPEDEEPLSKSSIKLD